MVDLGPAKESIHRHMGYLILLGGIIIAVKLLLFESIFWVEFPAH